jgi:hypothetical protein
MEALAADTNYLGCLCSDAVLDLLVHDGRFVFAEEAPVEAGGCVFHTTPLCQEMSCRKLEEKDPAPAVAVIYEPQAAAAGLPFTLCRRCVSVPFTGDVDAASLRFGITAWTEFAGDDEELRVVMMEDDVGVVHTVDCMLPEDGQDGECVLCLLEEVDAVAKHLEADLSDCDCEIS